MDGTGPGPMAAFKEASRLYRHIFYQLFRRDLETCHEKAEALAHLWFSIDKFLHQVGHPKPASRLGLIPSAPAWDDI